MYRLFTSIFLSAMVNNMVYGYPNMAPDSACGIMLPSHGVEAQSNNSDYTISLSSTSYTCGDTISVTLEGDTSFKGFLCQARTSVDMEKAQVGTFVIAADSTDVQTSCNNQSVTHTSASEKNSTTFSWVPADNHGNVYIVCSWVETKEVFWVREPSAVLAFQTGGNCTDGNPSANIGLPVPYSSALIVVLTLMASYFIGV